MNLFAAILSFGIVLLGCAGAYMGYGYIERNKKAKQDGIKYDVAQLRQNSRTGWASIGACIAVVLIGIAVYPIVSTFLSQQDTIYHIVKLIQHSTH